MGLILRRLLLAWRRARCNLFLPGGVMATRKKAASTVETKLRGVAATVDELSRSDPKIVTSANALGNAKLTLEHDTLGRLRVSVRHRGHLFGVPDLLSVRTTGAQMPAVRIERAHGLRTRPLRSTGILDILVDAAQIEHGPVDPNAMAKLVFYVSGFIFFEPKNNTAQFTVAGRDWTARLLEPYTDALNTLKDRPGSILVAIETDAPEKDLTLVRSSLDTLLWLLSFAVGGTVQVARQDVVIGGKVVRSTLFDTRPVRAPLLPPIWLDGPHSGLLKKYTEWSFDRWVSAESKYLLRSVTELLLLARGEPIVNVRALIVSNVLEILRYNFGANVLVPSGRATVDASSDEFYWARGALGNPKPNDTPKVTLAKMMETLQSDLRMTQWDPKFKNLRNKVMHTGEVPGVTVMDKYQSASDCLHFCDTVVLALLDWDAAGGKYIPANQPLDPTPGVHGNNWKSFVR